MNNDELDFYSKTSLKSYNLDQAMRYQLNLLDNLDVFTRKHCENVASITCRLCEYLHLSKSFTIYCTICAYLHDIGKLFIPPEILQKKGRLTEEEYAIMKTHTKIGYEMCFKDPKLRPYLAGALYHHEALDGTGYPNGLHGDQIPLEGQIIRIADEFDAIVSKRQYKTHIGITDTLKILIEKTQPDATLTKNEENLEALSELAEYAKLGKINKRVLKKLFKVVIDDTEYEISQTYDYVDYLKEQIDRLNKIDFYFYKMNQQKKEYKREYYKEMIHYSFENGENLENYKTILEEYKTAYQTRKQIIDKLFDEVKNIRRLKV
jgi:hypothetical protein